MLYTSLVLIHSLWFMPHCHTTSLKSSRWRTPEALSLSSCVCVWVLFETHHMCDWYKMLSIASSRVIWEEGHVVHVSTGASALGRLVGETSLSGSPSLISLGQCLDHLHLASLHGYTSTRYCLFSMESLWGAGKGRESGGEDGGMGWDGMKRKEKDVPSALMQFLKHGSCSSQ